MRWLVYVRLKWVGECHSNGLANGILKWNRGCDVTLSYCKILKLQLMRIMLLYGSECEIKVHLFIQYSCLSYTYN